MAGAPSVDARVSFNRMALPARIVGNGHTAALLSSLVTAAKRHHIDPFAYLREVEEFLPDKWKAAQARGGRETWEHRLSITHKFDPGKEANFDVYKSG